MAGPCPPLGRAPELCQLCGWALWLGLVLNSVNSERERKKERKKERALSSSCPPLGRAPELCQMCGWAVWLGLVPLLAAPLNSVSSVAGLCGPALLERSVAEQIAMSMPTKIH